MIRCSNLYHQRKTVLLVPVGNIDNYYILTHKRSTLWFKLTIKIPNEWKGEHVNLIWDSDSEALVCNEKGTPLQGLTGGDGNDKRWEFTITTTAAGNETYSFYIEMACNGLFGN